MGATDFGTQKITFKYGLDAASETFNKLHYSLFPTGLYSGATLTKVSDTIVTVGILKCYIQDTTNEIGLYVETAKAVNINVTNSAPFLILRLTWLNLTTNYMDMLAVSESNILASDLVLGKCIYSGSTMGSSFDYSRKTKSLLSDLKANDKKLKVLPTEPYSDQVAIEDAGEVIAISGRITVPAQLSSAISPTVLGRIDLLYIEDDGSITLEEGVDAASPSATSYANKRVVAEIVRGAARTNVTGNDIIQIDPSRRAEGNFVTTFMKTVLDDEDAAEMRTTMGLEKVMTVSTSEPGAGDGSDGDVWLSREV